MTRGDARAPRTPLMNLLNPGRRYRQYQSGSVTGVKFWLAVASVAAPVLLSNEARFEAPKRLHDRVRYITPQAIERWRRVTQQASHGVIALRPQCSVK